MSPEPETESLEAQTPPEEISFDFAAYPLDTCFHERRSGRDRRATASHGPDEVNATELRPARRKRERRRRVDPTTFEKQYTPDELEFMNAMHRFKVQSGCTFPTYQDVLKVASELGYRR